MKTCNKCRRTLSSDNYTSRKLPPKRDGTSGTSLKNHCKDCASLVRTCRKYQISEEYLLNLRAKQQNKCKICNQVETTVDGRYGRVRTLSVDHCHKTGKIRGLLCEDCNRAIGLLRDDTDLLAKAMTYLEETK